MDTDALERYVHDQIPLTKHMGLSVTALDGAGLTLTAPLGPNINDKGTAFAGSIGAMLTLSGWALLHALLSEEYPGIRIAVVDSDLTYDRPVQGDLHAVCDHPGAESLDAIRKTLTAKGKARMSLRARLLHESVVCAGFQGCYALVR